MLELWLLKSLTNELHYAKKGLKPYTAIVAPDQPTHSLSPVADWLTLSVLKPNFEGLCKLFAILEVFFEKKIEENAYFRNSADNILADDKFSQHAEG